MKTPQEQIDSLNDNVITEIQKLRKLKRQHPECRVVIRPTSRGSVLNAYREGDIDFKQAVEYLRTTTVD